MSFEESVTRLSHKIYKLEGLYKYGCIGAIKKETGGAKLTSQSPTADEIFKDRLCGNIYLSSKEDFKDQDELKPTVVTPIFHGKQREAELEAIVRKLRPFHPLFSESHIRSFSSSFLEKQYREPEWFQSEIWQELANCGVYSLTNTVTNKSLWEKYGDSGAGYVIRYEPDPLFWQTTETATLIDVAYVKNPVLFQSHADLFDLHKYWFQPGLASKRQKYDCEEEWRIVSRNLVREKMSIDPSIITEIYLGWAVNQKKIDEVLSIRDEIAPHIGVHRIDRFGTNVRKF